MAERKKKPQTGRKPTAKQSKFVDNYLENGGNATKAARDAGYSPKVAAEVGCENLRKSNVQERIRERIREANLNPQEIIGTLVSHMRGDLADILPEHKILKAARDAGVSHLIKEIEVTEHELPCAEGEKPIIEVKTKIKIHDSQSAAKHLTTVFGLEKAKETHPADVERAEAQKREALREWFEQQGILTSDAVQ
jgi:phage terminase small subunit